MSSPSLLSAPPGVHAGTTFPILPLPETDDFVELFRMHYPRLVRALLLAGATPEQADDVAQDAFARTFGHWRRVRRGTNPPGYAYRVAFRQLRRRGGLPTTPLDDAAVVASGLEEGAATRVDLEAALQAMPPRRRACAVLCLCLGLTPIEAGETLGIAAGTVRKQLDLARTSLRHGLAVRELRAEGS